MTPDELTASVPESRRDTLLAALDEPIDPEQAREICDELADIGIAVDRLYLDPLAEEGYETPMQIRASLGI